MLPDIFIDKNHSNYRNYSGFTIVELIIVIVISSIVVIFLTIFINGVTNQYAVSSTRTIMSSKLSNSNDRMSNDIRYSVKVLENNTVDDNAAPSSGTWKSSDTQLVLGQTARDSNGDSVSGDYPGELNNIIYYLKDHTLYRRFLAYPDTNNVSNTNTCSPTSGQYGCNADTKIISNVDSISFTYLDTNNNPVTTPSLASNIKIDIKLLKTRVGRTIKVTSSISNHIDNLGQAPTYDSNGVLYVGPGGLNAYNINFYDGTINIIGQLDAANGWTNFGSTSKPIAINILNKACTVGGVWPRPCPANKAIKGTYFDIYGTVCAKDQTSSSHIHPSSGLKPNCTPPISMPHFDKGKFTSSMKHEKPAPSCSFYGSITLEADTKYNGNINCQYGTLTVKGDTYINGNMGSSTSSFYDVKVADGVKKRPTIVTNGTIKLYNADVKTNSDDVGIDFISFDSTNGTCSNSDTCNSISDADLKSSTSKTYVNIQGFSNTRGSSFYSYFGGVRVYGGNVGPMSGQRVDIQGAANVYMAY